MYTRNVLLAAIAATVAQSEVFTVDVGKSSLRFNPQTINPKQGDTVIFHLYSPHNVVSGAFGSACISNDMSFFSGSYGQTDDGKKKFVVNVTTSDPVWYYCAVGRHCQEGMVGAWNAPSSGDTIGQYAQAAKNANEATTPQNMQGGMLLDDAQIASLTSGSSMSMTGSAMSSMSSMSPISSMSSMSSMSMSEATTTAPESMSMSSSTSASGSAASSTSTQGAAEALNAGPATGVLAAAVGLLTWLI